ncbi:hypothetical protein AAFC00_005046 [Neodothiora populina]|uniref:Glucose-methanol-choline oxidoreductase C-terminal domain-containing protein n=1 Tax=Neodothiora populina TaxID=2781224 RepID=A0ABR3PJM7_9PEZI
MGNHSNSNAVVDSRAKVIGVTGLRVVDVSAFPFLPPGHPTAIVYTLAEKIACDILGENRGNGHSKRQALRSLIENLLAMPKSLYRS